MNELLVYCFLFFLFLLLISKCSCSAVLEKRSAMWGFPAIPCKLNCILIPRLVKLAATTQLKSSRRLSAAMDHQDFSVSSKTLVELSTVKSIYKIKPRLDQTDDNKLSLLVYLYVPFFDQVPGMPKLLKSRQNLTNIVVYILNLYKPGPC